MNSPASFRTMVELSLYIYSYPGLKFRQVPTICDGPSSSSSTTSDVTIGQRSAEAPHVPSAVAMDTLSRSAFIDNTFKSIEIRKKIHDVISMQHMFLFQHLKYESFHCWKLSQLFVDEFKQIPVDGCNYVMLEFRHSLTHRLPFHSPLWLAQKVVPNHVIVFTHDHGIQNGCLFTQRYSMIGCGKQA